MTNICSASADMLQSRPIENKTPARTGVLYPKEGRVPMSSTILTPDSQSVKKPDEDPETCLHCLTPWISFGVCRLYSGWVFDLTYCPNCHRYYSIPPHPLLAKGPYAHQAYTFSQIKAETGGIYMLADESEAHLPAKPNVPSHENGGRS
jgi:hypothetical protein